MRVFIIGLGQIGMGYDLNMPEEQYVLTHSRAFSMHKRFHLVGGFDLNAQFCESFKKKYNCSAYVSLDEGLENSNPDIVIVSTPTETHDSIIQSIFSLCHPKIILCEKPLSYSIEEARNILKICKDNNCMLFANYLRRSNVGVKQVLQRLTNGQIQKPIKGHVWYSKGLFNSASHFIDLLMHLFGDVLEYAILKKGRRWKDIDPEPDFELRFKEAEFRFFSLKEENFFHNSMEFFSQNGRLRYEQGGSLISWENIVRSSTFSNYTMLNTNAEIIHSDFQRIQLYVVNELAELLDGKQAWLCPGEDALKNVELCTILGELNDTK